MRNAFVDTMQIADTDGFNHPTGVSSQKTNLCPTDRNSNTPAITDPSLSETAQFKYKLHLWNYLFL